jgi:hypothetical protein
MKKHSMFHIPFMSFYSKALYRDVAHNWKGTGFLYLLILLAICWLPTMASMHSGLSGGIDRDRSEVVSKHKPSYGKSGKAAYSQSHYHVTGQKSGRLSLTDLSGQQVSPDRIAIHIFTTFIKIILRAQANPDKEPDLSTFLEIFDFDQAQQTRNSSPDAISNYMLFIIYLLALAGSYVFRILQVLVYAAIGQLFCVWAGAKLEYDALMRLSVVAITPVIIVAAIVDAVGIQIPFSWVWAFLFAMGYLYFGVRAVARGERDAKQSPA